VRALENKMSHLEIDTTQDLGRKTEKRLAIISISADFLLNNLKLM